MSEYNFEFKQKVVEYYINTNCGYQLTANHFNVSKSIVRKWIKNYSKNGIYVLRANENTVL